MANQAQEQWPALGVAARGVVSDDAGRVLLIRRAPDVHLDPGRWELPGGKMEHGEELAEALAREIREETGLVVEVLAPFHVSHFTFEPFWVTCVTFACERSRGEVELSEEHDDSAWVAHSELGDRELATATREQLDAYAALPKPA